MMLNDWLVRENLKVSQFAKIVGVESMTMRRYAKNKRLPAPAVMQAIFEHTKGEVSPNDFFKHFGRVIRLDNKTLTAAQAD